MAAGLSLEECVKTIVDTLPVRSEHGVAYSTFTIIRIDRNQTAEVIQYDNPPVIYIHNDKVTSYPKIEMHVDGKTILRSVVRLSENDLFVVMSDGCPHAGTGRSYNYSWEVSDIAQFMAEMSMTGYTAKVLSTMLVEQCDKLYGGEPGDDATACVVKMHLRGNYGFHRGGVSAQTPADGLQSRAGQQRPAHVEAGRGRPGDGRGCHHGKGSGLRAGLSEGK